MSSSRAASPSWSLATRLTVWYAISTFLIVAFVTGVLYRTLERNLEEEEREFIEDMVDEMRDLLGGAGGLEAVRVEADRLHRARERILLRVLDGRGEVLVEAPGMSAVLPPGLFRPDEPGRSVRAIDGRPYRVLAATAPVRGGGGTWTIHAALDFSGEEDLLSAYRARIWTLLAVTLLGSSLVGHAIARRGIRPLREIAETAGRIRPETLHERISVERFPEELRALAATFNGMLDRLEDSFDRLSRFSADIAHELRTPVQNLRGDVEVALARPRPAEEYRSTLESAMDETERLAHIIDGLLFLARAERPAAEIRRERLDLGQEIEAIRAFYEAAAEERGIRLTASVSPGLVAMLDRTLFQRAVGNLIENALAHTPAGGTVAILTGPVDGGVEVSVRDTGRGIAQEHLPRVFDRFYRGDPARAHASGGSGLGLAIVRTIVTLHGGTATIESEPGKGTVVILRFPTAFEMRGTRQA